MDESHLGFKQEGDWHDVVVFGEKAYLSARQSIELMDIPEEDREQLRELAEEFDDWRPKIEEHSSEVSDKTAENASVDPPEPDDIQNNMDRASDNIKESLGAVEDNDPKKAGSHWKETTESLVLATGGTLKRVLQWVEKSVYKNLMTLISPYYFDNELFSASLWKKSGGGYIFELVPNNDQFRELFEEEIDVMSDKGRWHVDYEDSKLKGEHITPEVEEEVSNKRSKEVIEDHIEQMEDQNKEVEERKESD